MEDKSIPSLISLHQSSKMNYYQSTSSLLEITARLKGGIEWDEKRELIAMTDYFWLREVLTSKCLSFSLLALFFLLSFSLSYFYFLDEDVSS